VEGRTPEYALSFCRFVGDETISMCHLESMPIALQMRQNTLKTYPAFSDTQSLCCAFTRVHSSIQTNTWLHFRSDTSTLSPSYSYWGKSKGSTRERIFMTHSASLFIGFLSESSVSEAMRKTRATFLFLNTQTKLPATQAEVRSPIGLCNSLGHEREDTEADCPG
jgi:hypothetical protein